MASLSAATTTAATAATPVVAGAGDKYHPGDRVFAKLKGWPWWPSKVKERISGKVEAYKVYFYGTYDEGTVKLDQIMEYNEESLAKFSKKPPRNAKFPEAMIEIERNMDIFDKKDQVEPPVTEDMEEGELLIDEGPPVLTKEVNKPVSSANKSTAGSATPLQKPSTVILAQKSSAAITPALTEVPPTPKQASRRGSRAGKRVVVVEAIPPPAELAMSTSPASNISATGTKQESLSTPAPSVATPPQPEIVSRSGRKIKPKRFADDYDTSTTAAKPDPAEGPPAFKRVKRTTSNSKQNAQVEAQDKLATPATRRSGTNKQGSAALPPPPLLQINTPQPILNAAATGAIRKLPALSRGKSSGPGNATSSSKTQRETATTKQEVGGTDERNDEEKLGLEPISAPSRNINMNGRTTVKSEDLHEKVPQAKGARYSYSNGNGLVVDEDEDEDEYEDDESGMADDANEAEDTIQKIPIHAKNGVELELSLDSSNEQNFKTLKSKAMYDISTAKNVVKIKAELEKSEESANEFIAIVVENIENKDDELGQFMNDKLKENVEQKIQQLRMEGEMIEIIGEIIASLNVRTADCDRALDLLNRLSNQTLNTFILKKHPEVVDTVRQLRNYHGNVEDWKFTKEQKSQFAMKSDMIRKKCETLYQTFKSLFCSSSQKPFQVVFTEEVNKFTTAVFSLSPKSIYTLVKDPTPTEVTPDTSENKTEPESCELPNKDSSVVALTVAVPDEVKVKDELAVAVPVVPADENENATLTPLTTVENMDSVTSV